MRRWGQSTRCGALAFALAVTTVGGARLGHAVPVDRNGEIQLGVRAYTAARVGTEATERSQRRGLSQRIVERTPDGDVVRLVPLENITQQSLTFPVSSAGSLRQHRTFLEVDWNHDIDRLVKDYWGPLGLLNELPVPIRRVSYRFTYRGEHEGLYDWGPQEYRTAVQYHDPELVPPNTLGTDPVPVDVGRYRRKLRDVGSSRHRLFQAYAQGRANNLFFRFGRQILVWGETDAFRLLDNINPMDASFGGFLVPLDERRVPLDMLLLRYSVGRIRPLGMRDVSVEAYGAVDNSVGFAPGIQQGSAWTPPNLGTPSALVETTRTSPGRNFSEMRGGARLRWGMRLPAIRSADFSLAHYYTYLDLPAVQFVTNRDFLRGLPQGRPGAGALTVAQQTAPLTQITGATTTFAVPPQWVRPLGISAEPIIRAEIAYFKNEGRYRQSEIDPFQFALPRQIGPIEGMVPPDVCPPDKVEAGLCYCPGGTVRTQPDGSRLCYGKRRLGDSWNAVLGVDLQQRINWLNPDSSFFITTQVFYKHLNNAAKRRRLPAPPGGQSNCDDPVRPTSICFSQPLPEVYDGEVLPVPEFLLRPRVGNVPVRNLPPAAPIYVRTPTDQIMHTLLIMTSYFGGRVNPMFGMIYDWQGALVVQPQLTLSQDPWRFSVNYSHLVASRLRGGSGISLLRDRDNVLFQVEYAL